MNFLNPLEQSCGPDINANSRRAFISRLGAGLGGVALWQVLDRDLLVAAEAVTPLAHHAPKAKRVIQLFMNGGPFQADFFDPKPAIKQP